jgi:uncharacterized membrane-anchored protein
MTNHNFLHSSYFKFILSGAFAILSFLSALFASKATFAGLIMWGGMMSFVTLMISIIFLANAFESWDTWDN